jgi:hypothetical protein
MIAKHEEQTNKIDLWAALAAKLPTGVISWRQDGKAIVRDGRFLARFVAYIEANTVRERLDSVVPGEWDYTLEPLPSLAGELDDDANMGACNFKARLTILGVIREDVGTGKDWKQAATDAFKRVAVRFGIGHELYDYEQNWVQMDGEGKYAKPLEEPGAAYARRHGQPAARVGDPATPAQLGKGITAPRQPAPAPGEGEAIHDGAGAPLAAVEHACPKCGGRMWDNRLTKRNPKAPDYKCRDRSCDGVIWPPKDEASPATRKPSTVATDDEIPF